MKLVFRKATEKDWRTVLLLEKSVSGEYYHSVTKEDEVKKYIKKSNVFLIQKGTKTVGTISYDLKDNGHADVDGLTVYPTYQRQGIATNAMEFLMNKLKKVKRVTLVVHPRNTPAIRLYLKFGFHIEDWKDNYFGDGKPRLTLVKD